MMALILTERTQFLLEIGIRTSPHLFIGNVGIPSAPGLAKRCTGFCSLCSAYLKFAVQM